LAAVLAKIRRRIIELWRGSGEEFNVQGRKE